MAYINVGHAATKAALATCLNGLEALTRVRDAAVQAQEGDPILYTQVEDEFQLATGVGHGAAFFAELDSVYLAVSGAAAALRQAAAMFGVT